MKIEHKFELGNQQITLETNRIAKQADASVVVTCGETMVMANICAAKTQKPDIDFFPLTVNYQEKYYASGKIPGGFFKREARPSEHEILTSRLTDRPLRPLFPKSFKYETQVIVTAMSSDGENMADVLAGVGASAALMVSDIPFSGPIATVRVGRVGNNFIVNPTREQMSSSDMEIIVSGNDSTIVMVEGEAKLITEEEFLDALKFAHGPIKELIALQNKLVSELDIIKREAPLEEDNSEIEKSVEKLVSEKIDNAINAWAEVDAYSYFDDENTTPLYQFFSSSDARFKVFDDWYDSVDCFSNFKLLLSRALEFMSLNSNNIIEYHTSISRLSEFGFSKGAPELVSLSLETSLPPDLLLDIRINSSCISEIDLDQKITRLL